MLLPLAHTHFISQIGGLSPLAQAHFLYAIHPDLWIANAPPRLVDGTWREIGLIERHRSRRVRPELVAGLEGIEAPLRQALLERGYRYLQELTGELPPLRVPGVLAPSIRGSGRESHPDFVWHGMTMDLSEPFRPSPAALLVKLLRRHEGVHLFMRRTGGDLHEVPRSALPLVAMRLRTGERIEWLARGEEGREVLDHLRFYNANEWWKHYTRTQPIATFVRDRYPTAATLLPELGKMAELLQPELSAVYHLERRELAVGHPAEGHDTIAREAFGEGIDPLRMIRVYFEVHPGEAFAFIPSFGPNPSPERAEAEVRDWLGDLVITTEQALARISRK